MTTLPNPATPTPRRPAAAALALLLAATAGAVESSPERTPPRLADLSIEQLLNESVTSVSKKETRLGDSAAAATGYSGYQMPGLFAKSG